MSLKRVVSVLALCVTLPSCALVFGGGPSEVAQGRYYSSGHAEFDGFFVEVYRLQVSMAQAPNELAEARRTLTSALVLADSAQNAEIAEKLRIALNGMSARGARVHFEVRLPTPPDPEHSMALITATPTPEGNERALLSSVEASLSRLLRLAATMHVNENQLVQLRAAVPPLQAKVDPLLLDQGPRKRTRTRLNLDDADRVIVLMQARASEIAAPVDGLYKELGRVFGKNEAPPPEPAVEAPKPEEKPKPRPVTAPRPRAERADPGPVAAPAAKPAPATKSADFEP